VSAVSALWTICVSAAAITVGLLEDSAVLVAFGSIGFVDAVGSIALVHHFRHGIRTEELSDRLERLAHRIVLAGLAVVGCGAILGGVARLVTGTGSDSGVAAAILAAVSLVVLVGLAAKKEAVSRQVGSEALRSDAHLSAVGAAQAAVALLGIAASRWLSWHSADAGATVLVGCVATVIAARTWRADVAQRRGRVKIGSMHGLEG
jgi:divalent metal cation (Fe/Co/Zn/Cd) transporter